MSSRASGKRWLGRGWVAGLIGCGVMSGASMGNAADYTWSATPVNNDFNLVSNWVPNTGAPSSVADRGFFNTSSITSITPTNGLSAGALIFNAGASSYTITSLPGLSMAIRGAGVTNNSAATQTFVVGSGMTNTQNILVFFNAATITGSNVVINTQGTSLSTAMSGSLQFADTASAGTASIFNLSATAAGGVGGSTTFFNSSNAGTATITNSANAAGTNSQRLG